MATKDELFAAVRTISQHCALNGPDCSECPLFYWCNVNDSQGMSIVPEEWPDPEEGGGEGG